MTKWTTLRMILNLVYQMDILDEIEERLTENYLILENVLTR